MSRLREIFNFKLFKLFKPAAVLISVLIVFFASYYFKNKKNTSKSFEDISFKISVLDEKLAQNPFDIKALSERGRLKYQLGVSSYVSAASDIEKARENGRLDSEDFKYLAKIYYRLGLYDFSARETRKYLNNDGEDFEMNLLLGKLFYMGKDYQNAFDIFSVLAAKEPNNHTLKENIIMCLYKQKKDYSRPLLEMISSDGVFLCRGNLVQSRIKFEEKAYIEAVEAGQKVIAQDCLFSVEEKILFYETMLDSYLALKDWPSAFSCAENLLSQDAKNEKAKKNFEDLKKKTERVLKSRLKK